MPDQVDTTKIIDLGNLKYYHSRLSANYLVPLNERVTSFATSSEIDEYLFNITSISVDEPISNDYAITGMGLNALINDNDSSDESIDAYDYPKVLSINVAPGTCTINDTLYNVPFTTLNYGLQGTDSSGSSVLTILATEQDNDVILSLEEGEVSSDNLQSNQVLIGTVTYSDSGISGISPTPSGANAIISAPTIEAGDSFSLSLSDGVISIQGKCYRIYNDVVNNYTFEDLDDVASSCGAGDDDGHLDEPVAYLSPAIPESSEACYIELLVPKEAFHDNSSYTCCIENYAGSLDVYVLDREDDYSNDIVGRTRAFPVKLTVRVSAEGITSSIPGGTNLVGITAYWMSNGSFVREKRWVSSTNALQSGSEVSIEVDTPVAMIERVELNEEDLGPYINLSSTSNISAYIDHVAVPQYIVACVRNNRLAFKYMTYTSDSPTLATDEIIVGKVVYSYNSSSEEAEATIIPASEL